MSKLDGMALASRSFVLAGWASGEWRHVGGCRRVVVVEDHPARPTGWIEQQICDQGRPTGLMHGSESGAVVAVKVLIEQEIVFPGRVGLQKFDAPVDGPPAVGARKPDADQPIGEIAGDVTQRQLLARIRSDIRS